MRTSEILTLHLYWESRCLKTESKAFPKFMKQRKTMSLLNNGPKIKDVTTGLIISFEAGLPLSSKITSSLRELRHKD